MLLCEMLIGLMWEVGQPKWFAFTLDQSLIQSLTRHSIKCDTVWGSPLLSEAVVAACRNQSSLQLVNHAQVQQVYS